MLEKLKDLFSVRAGDSLAAKVTFNAKHPAFPTAVFSIIILSFSYNALFRQSYSLFSYMAYFLVGVLVWTLTEYCLHRFVFHLTRVREPWKTIFSGLHMDHHRKPDDKYLIVAPPTVSIFVSALLFSIFLLISKSAATAGVIMAGVGFGYICYEWIHYGTHQYKWRSALGLYLTRHHLHHHFKNPNEAFGVTSGFWDRVFGTPRSPVASPNNMMEENAL